MIILVIITANGCVQMKASAQSADANSNGILDNLLNNSTKNTQLKQGSVNSTQPEPRLAVRASPSANDTVGAGIGTNETTPNQTPANITATINSVMSPKALLSSAIEQIQNSTSKGFSNQSASKSNAINLNTGVMQLANQIIPAKDFILIFFGDKNSFTNGNVYAKLPCDNKSQSALQILLNNKPNSLLPINGLSHPGGTCLYRVELSNRQNSPEATSSGMNSTHTNSTSQYSNNLNSTAIELFNPTSHPVVLPSTSSIALSLQLVYDSGPMKGH